MQSFYKGYTVVVVGVQRVLNRFDVANKDGSWDLSLAKQVSKAIRLSRIGVKGDFQLDRL